MPFFQSFFKCRENIFMAHIFRDNGKNLQQFGKYFPTVDFRSNSSDFNWFNDITERFNEKAIIVERNTSK